MKKALYAFVLIAALTSLADPGKIELAKTTLDTANASIMSTVPRDDVEVIRKNSYAVRAGKKDQKFALLRLEKEYPDNMYPISFLRGKGHKQYQKQCHINEKLVSAIENY